MKMAEKEITFDVWSDMWDKLFTICKMRNDFRALLAHTFRYKTKWNRGL